MKEKYGNDITIMGNFDIGGILAEGNPESIRNEVKYYLEKLMPGGGYIAMSSNSLDDCVVPENYITLVDAVLEYGIY